MVEDFSFKTDGMFNWDCVDVWVPDGLPPTTDKDGSVFSLLFSLSSVVFGFVIVGPFVAVEVEEISDKELLVVVRFVFDEDFEFIDTIEEVGLETVEAPFEYPEIESEELDFCVSNMPVVVVVVEVGGGFVLPPTAVLVLVIGPSPLSTVVFCDGIPLPPLAQDEVGEVGVRREDIMVTGFLGCPAEPDLGRTPSPNSLKGGITRFVGSVWWFPFLCGWGILA